jgi:membrane protease YdiL (CAAX protease family)
MAQSYGVMISAMHESRQESPMASLSIPDHVPIVARDVDAEVSRLVAQARPRLNAKRAVWIATCWFVNQLAAAIVLTLVAAPLSIAFGARSGALSGGVSCCIETVSSLIATVGAVSMFRMSFASMEEYKRALGERAVSIRMIVFAAVVGLVLNRFGAQILCELFPPSKTQNLGPLVAAMQEGRAARIAVAACAVLGAPLIEEFFFRGVLYSALARSCSVIVAASVTTLVFVLLHVSSLSPYWPRLASVLLLGVAAQVARTRTGSIWPGVAMHFAWNALSFLPGVFH